MLKANTMFSLTTGTIIAVRLTGITKKTIIQRITSWHLQYNSIHNVINILCVSV